MSEAERAAALLPVIEKLRPLVVRLGRPRADDWLAQHREDGQTFKEYLAGRPTLPTGRRGTICVQPLGEFTETQRRIVGQTADFLAICFGLPVRVEERLPLGPLPENARRRHPEWGMQQILSGHILDEVLLKRMPDDAAVYLAFTATDLWPGRGWNFVFGEASIRERVGVWSIYRNGDPDKSADDYRLCLLRTIKTAAHETGHMFSMLHCTAYECNMCGSNHLEESDRRPLAECPECMAKLCWATGADPVERLRKLAAFCKKHGLAGEEANYRKLLDALSPVIRR